MIDLVMFSGIIEELGIIKEIRSYSETMKLTIKANIVLKDVKLGDSIAVNGVCLTVTTYTADEFSADVMPETYRSTSLAQLKLGDRVNLESSLRFNGKVGGHFVTGHVDGVGRIKKIEANDNAINYTIETDKELMQYFIYKGSIAIDGTSLTIFGLDENRLKIALIPHTVKHSAIGNKKVGDIVNIEADMLGKYVLKNINQQQEGLITKNTLAEHGFI